MHALPQTRDDIAELIPHQGDMCLLDRVIAWDDHSIHCLSHRHRDPQLPLREAGQLAAVHLCEYGAQATAVHGALLARAQNARASAGLLVALRDIKLQYAYVDEQTTALHVHATQLQASSAGSQYEFRVLADDDATWLASGKVTVAFLQE